MPNLNIYNSAGYNSYNTDYQSSSDSSLKRSSIARNLNFDENVEGCPSQGNIALINDIDEDAPYIPQGEIDETPHEDKGDVISDYDDGFSDDKEDPQFDDKTPDSVDSPPLSPSFFLKRAHKNLSFDLLQSPPSTPQKNRHQTPVSTPQKPNPLSPSKWTPEKNYAFKVVHRKGKDYINVELSPNFKKKYEGESVVYRIKVGEKRYIGAAGDNVIKRLSSHRSDANQARRGDTETSKIAQSLGKTPEKHVFGVIKISSLSNLDQDERTAINVKDSVKNGFNTRNGGGGGSVQRTPEKEKPKPLKKSQIEKIEDKLETNFEEIKWHSFYKKKNGTIFDRMPKQEKRIADAIYVIAVDVFNSKTQRDEEKLYIGYTTTQIGKRLTGHRHCINNPDKKRAVKQKMYKLINEDPEKARVGILPLKGLERIKATKAQIEKIAIDVFNTKENGFNLRKGGGGGFSKK